MDASSSCEKMISIAITWKKIITNIHIKNNNNNFAWEYCLGVAGLFSKTLGSIFRTGQLRNGPRDSLLLFSFLAPNCSAPRQTKTIQRAWLVYSACKISNISDEAFNSRHPSFQLSAILLFRGLEGARHSLRGSFYISVFFNSEKN